MGVYVTAEGWKCEDCWGVFSSLFAADSDTKPLCPYCRIATLESSHAELLEAAQDLLSWPSMHTFDQTVDVSSAVKRLQAAVTRATEEKQ